MTPQDLGPPPHALRDFVIADIGLPNTADRILLFGRVEVLGDMCAADTLFMDWLKKIPNDYITGIYGLLPNKEGTTYATVLRQLRTVCTMHNHRLNPRVVISDFEQGILK